MVQLPALRLIAVNGVGYDRIDLAECARRSIVVANTPDVLTDDVADLAVGLVISLLRDIARADRHVRSGAWDSGEFPLTRRVSGSRFGIVGLGRIGTAIARRLEPFGEVAYCSRSRKDVRWTAYPDPAALARDSDVLVISSAANASTRGMIGTAELEMLGPQGYLVNVARGDIVDQSALLEALGKGRIAGAALDVFADEPAVPEPLTLSGKTLLTPHIGSATLAAREAMADRLCANVEAFLRGEKPAGTVGLRVA